MATAVKQAKQSAKPAKSPREKLVEDRQKLLEAVEEIMLRHAAGGELSHDDRTLLESMGWDRSRVEGERRRCARIVSNRAEAGTAEAFQKAKQLVGEAVEAEGRIPELKEKIVELQREIASIEANRQIREGKLRSMQAARRTLRSLVPDHIREEHSTRADEIERKYCLDIADCMQVIDRATAIERADAESAFRRERERLLICDPLIRREGFEYLRPEETIAKGKGSDRTFRKRKITDDQWNRLRDETAKGLPEAKRRLAEIQDAKAEELAAIDAMLDLYLPK